MKDKSNVNSFKDFLNENDNRCLAPNGKPSNLPKKLYKYVRTEEFKKWFGDWVSEPSKASKVLDGNGEPLVVYHGTNKRFDKFDIDIQKIGWLGKGFYFTDNIGMANEYGNIVMDMFLNIRSPFIVKGESPSDVIYEVKKAYESPDENFHDSDVSIILKKHNHDGVFYKHWDNEGRMLSCFNSSQIKKI